MARELKASLVTSSQDSTFSFARMKEMFNDVFGPCISEGGIHYLLERFSKKTIPAYQQIKERIAIGRVVGTDETGARVGGGKDWLWTWQNHNSLIAM